MKKAYILLIGAAIPALSSAQTAVDAQQITQSDFKGTARYMSMGGAFTALGGDLSAINQNPAGIGLYRRSEVGITLGLDFQKSETPATGTFANSMTQTKVTVPNFGYVGSTQLGGALRTFNWGVSYNRATSFDRVYTGYVPNTLTSLSDYVADYTYGVDPIQMEFANNYNPYLDSFSTYGKNIDWLSILSYSSLMISPIGYNGDNAIYTGLSKEGTIGDAGFTVRESGYVDEYNITFGGNVEDIVYWGMNIGITDLQYKRYALYDESMSNALVPIDKEATALTNGAAYFNLDNFKYINGSGWNMKFGVIIKPVNEFRIGLAVHTPTWYRLTQGYDGKTNYTYTPTDLAGTPTDPTINGNDYSENAYFEWKLAAPWRFMVGVAGVIGQRAIISADYQFDGYNSMKISTPIYDSYNYINGFASNDVLNNDISTYYRNANTLRLGVEYRLTPQLSARAGYNARFSNTKKEVQQGLVEVIGGGTDPSFTFDDDTQHYSLGLGYKYQAWYIDVAYVYKHRQSVYHAYTNWPMNDHTMYQAPTAKVTDKNSMVMISTGLKF